MKAGNFSGSAIPDAAFEVPAGYRKLEKSRRTLWALASPWPVGK
jgi:hypothetical protein